MKIWIFTVIIISSILLTPLLHFGFPPSHDGEYHIIRAYQFDKTLRDGDLYPRWQSDVNNGYGSPLMNYYYPLPYFAISLFHFLGFGFIDGYKLSLAFATLFGSVLFFLWTRQFWGNIGGLVSAVVYSFSPYHIVDLYVRGALGEVWSLAFFPGFAFFATMLFKNKEIKYLPVSGIFLGLLIFSHNILGYMLFVFSIIYCLFLIILFGGKKPHIKFKFDKKPFLWLSTVILLGLGISAIFWIPALFEQKFVRGLQIYNVLENFPQFYQLLIPSWGTGFSNTDQASQMSFQIGIINILAVLIGIFSGFRLFKNNKKEAVLIYFFIISFFLVLFLMLRVSFSIWQNIPFLNYFQFPWRMLSLEIIITSFLAGSIIKLFSRKILPYSLIAVSIFVTIGYTKPAYFWEREDNYYFSRSNFIDGTNTPGNIFNTIWFNTLLKKQKEKAVFIKGNGKIDTKQIKSTYYKFVIDSYSSSMIQINTAYFPGWSAFVDGKRVALENTDNGLGSFTLGKGKHDVAIKFENTPIRNIASLISAGSVILSLIFLKPFVSLRRFVLVRKHRSKFATIIE